MWGISIPGHYNSNLAATIPIPLSGNVHEVPKPGCLEVGWLGRDSVPLPLNRCRQTAFPKCSINSPHRAGQKELLFLDVTWNPGFCLHKGFSGHLLVAWEVKFPGQKEEWISWLRRWPLLHCRGHLRGTLAHGSQEPGTTCTGSELIMSFYELWGP